MPHAVLRRYDDAPDLAAGLLEHVNEVQALLAGIVGFRSWGLFSVGDGCSTLTVCDTKEGCDESVAIAAAWLKENLPDMQLQPPTVTDAIALARVTADEIVTD